LKLKRTIVILFLMLSAIVMSVPQAAFAQPDLKYLYSIPVGSATAISTDRNNAVYFLNPGRNLIHLDSLGRVVSLYSPPNSRRATSIEAWNPMKVFAFYEDRQELLLLDRFFKPLSSVLLSDFGINGTIKAATLASDEGFWLFDETDLRLSKLEINLRKLTIETPLNLILDRNRFDVRMLREYQNMVYMLDYNSGVYVFDNLGNYKQKLPITGVAYIGFINNELYFVKDGALHFLDLYKHQQRTINFPQEKKYTSALVTQNRIYLFTRKTADVYNL
jgi:hypothetical protein